MSFHSSSSQGYSSSNSRSSTILNFSLHESVRHVSSNPLRENTSNELIAFHQKLRNERLKKQEDILKLTQISSRTPSRSRGNISQHNQLSSDYKSKISKTQIPTNSSLPFQLMEEEDGNQQKNETKFQESALQLYYSKEGINKISEKKNLNQDSSIRKTRLTINNDSTPMQGSEREVGKSGQLSYRNIEIGPSLNISRSMSQQQSFRDKKQQAQLEYQENKYNDLHQQLRNSINRINKQQMMKEATLIHGGVDVLLATGIQQIKNIPNTTFEEKSLNQKLLDEGIISNSSKGSFIKRTSPIRTIQAQSQPNLQKPTMVYQEDFIKTNLLSYNDRDMILGQNRRKERIEILSRLPKNRNEIIKSSEIYNKWFVNPKCRSRINVNPQSATNNYSFVNNEFYLYEEMGAAASGKRPFEELDSHQSGVETKNKSLNSERIRNTAANFPVIQAYTKRLLNENKRIPIFIRQPKSHDPQMKDIDSQQ